MCMEGRDGTDWDREEGEFAGNDHEGGNCTYIWFRGQVVGPMYVT